MRAHVLLAVSLFASSPFDRHARGGVRVHHPTEESRVMIKAQTPCQFDDIEPGSETRNACTPKVDFEFVGIRIAAPEEVLFGPGTRDSIYGGFTRLIVAGVCELPYDTLGLRDDWNRAIVLVAVDTEAKRVYSGRFGAESIFQPAESLDPQEEARLHRGMSKSMVVGRVFNSNIANDLHLPPEPAAYDVYATLGPYRSNVVHVRVKRIEEARP